jgi:hypothetical protein
LDEDLPEWTLAPPAVLGQTRRFFAAPGLDTTVVYTAALLRLLEYARGHPHAEFVFGPVDAAAARAGGLVLSGADLAGPAEMLADLPGLAEYEPEEEPEAAVARLSRRAGLGVPQG